LQKGASNIKIAGSLFISKFTVKAHLSNIFKNWKSKKELRVIASLASESDDPVGRLNEMVDAADSP
jgi:DNA-binding NarL/FixJ family response regulator